MKEGEEEEYCYEKGKGRGDNIREEDEGGIYMKRRIKKEEGIV